MSMNPNTQPWPSRMSRVPGLGQPREQLPTAADLDLRQERR